MDVMRRFNPVHTVCGKFTYLLSVGLDCYCYKTVVPLFAMAFARGGTNSSIFLNIGETLDPQVFLGVVLCIKNEIIF